MFPQTYFFTKPGVLATPPSLWLKADAGVTVNAGGVSYWRDQSGAGAHAYQTDSGKRPVWRSDFLNFNPVVDFNGSDEFISGTKGFSTQTFFIVAVNDEEFSRNKSGQALLNFNNNGNNYFGLGSMTSHLNNEIISFGAGQDVFYRSGWTGDGLFAAGPHLFASWRNQSGAGPAQPIQVTGQDVVNAEYSPAGGMWADEAAYTLGAKRNSNGSVTNAFRGKIAELIAFKAPLGKFDRAKVQSYLALKYGLTLDQDQADPDLRAYYDGSARIVWNPARNPDFKRDIAGIGKDENTTLNQTRSKSSNENTFVTIGSPTDLNNGEYLVWAADGGAVDFVAAGAPDGYRRLGRRWQVQETGDVGAVSVLGLGTHLVVDREGDGFANNAPTPLSMPVNLNDGDIFTFLVADVELCGAPGGVSDGLASWLRADAGVSRTAAGAVNYWEDYSGRNHSLSQTDPNRQPLWSNASINFNPAVHFSKSQGQFLQSSAGGFSTRDYFLVFVPNEDLYAGGAGGTLIGAARGDRRFDFGYNAFTTALDNELLFHSVDLGFTYSSGFTDDRRIVNSFYPYIANARDNSRGDGTEIFFNGLPIQNARSGAWMAMEDVPFALGAAFAGSRPHDGKIAELIVYDNANSNDRRRRIQSYLALKYGVTLDQSAPDLSERHYYNSAGAIVWNAETNRDYARDIAGIGIDPGSCLTQLLSQSQNPGGVLTIGFASNHDPGEFLLWGNNGQPITEYGAGDAPRGFFVLSRVWRAQETGEVGPLQISFANGALGKSNGAGYVLIVDTDNDGAFQDETPRPFSFDGKNFVAKNVNLNNGNRFTIAVKCDGEHTVDHTIREEYYLPIPEDQVLAVLQTLYPSAAACNRSVTAREPRAPVFNYTSITTQGRGTFIVYDHWEDGFEADLEHPQQPGTEIWGDANPMNGYPPGFPCDIILADAIVLDEAIDPANRGSGLYYDGGDRLGASGPISITKANWSEGGRTLFGGAVEVFATDFWSRQYIVPFGQNVATATQSLEYVGALVMAREDNTQVTIDLNGDGSVDERTTLNQGQSRLVNGGLRTGALISASAPVQVHLATGDICENFESRWFSLPGDDVTCGSYYSAVSDNSVMYYFYNPNSAPITIKCRTASASPPDILVPAKAYSTQFFSTSQNDGLHFYTENDARFYAAFLYSVNDPNGRGADYDWGATLMCEELLPQSLQLGWANGQDPLLPRFENGSPIWLTAAYPRGSSGTKPISVCVDFNGDNIGPFSEGADRNYDLLLSLKEYEAVRIFDPDGDQTGTIISVCDGSDAVLSAHWGGDQSAASDGQPGLDLGTGIPISFPYYVHKQVAGLDGNDRYYSGEEIIYTIEISALGQNSINGIFFLDDPLPAGLNYVPGSVELTLADGRAFAIPDDVSGQTPFPLDEGGLQIRSDALLNKDKKITVRFRARIQDDFEGRIVNSANVNFRDYNREDEVAIEVTPPDKFDLSLRKSLHNTTPGPFAPGDPVAFRLEIKNEGSLDATGIQVVDYIPAGLRLSDPDWEESAPGLASLKIPVASLAAGASASVEISFVIDENFQGISLTNAAEIASAGNDQGLNDQDSTPDDNPDNDDDEDDFDTARIDIRQQFDLSLNKTLSPATPGPFSPGDPVVFRLEIKNEGSLDATDIQINDYIPAGLLPDDPDWQENTPGRATLKTPITSLAAGASASVEISFLIVENFQGINLTNAAEIASAANAHGLKDEDSTPDNNPGNDAGEDDFDTQSIPLSQSFDLSLSKSLSATTPGPFSPGDAVVFRLEIANHGSLDATNIQLNDYIPAGLRLNDPDWQENTPGRARLKTPIVSLAAGASTSVEISFVIDEDFQGISLTNAAEIASAANAFGQNDGDSTPDNNPDNDAGEDDFDTQGIPVTQSFDLSLGKTLSTTTPGPFSPGDAVVFRLEITNQGSLDATNIQLVDYIPAGLQLNDSDWQETAPGIATLKTPIANLAAGASLSVDISFVIDRYFQQPGLVNAAEIASAANAFGQNDEDSTPDDNPANDAGEDDFDTAGIDVSPSFDLSLSKTLSTTTPGPFAPGDAVIFRLEITNQGSLDATGIQINDYIPAGLSLNDPAWEETAPGLARLKTPLASLAASSAMTIDVMFVIDPGFQGSGLTNAAEIASAANGQGLNDEDSTPDDNPQNDAGEDDYDTQSIAIGQTFDLSLRKTLSNTTPGPFSPGDAVIFRLEITNEGSLDATGIQLVDYIPAGLSLDDPAWEETASGLATLKTPPANLAAGTSLSVDILFVVDETFQGLGLTNAAEIASAANAHGQNDGDSTPDSNPGNDVAEDDFDTEQIGIEQTFDLSLIKTLSNATPGPFTPGDPVVFRLEITNEGSLNATNIQVNDYIPAGLLLNDPDWEETTPGRATLKTPIASLAAGASLSVDIAFIVDPNFQGAELINAAEIASALNEHGMDDEDSIPDSDPDNDPKEDDFGVARIEVGQTFDLSLHKTLSAATPGPFAPGDPVVFRLQITNQGSLNATNIQLNDYIPAGLFLSDPNWQATAPGVATLKTPVASLAGGANTSVDIRFVLDENFQGVSLTNAAEIASAANAQGQDDEDSSPDNNPNNDAGEDDFDTRSISIGQSFDLSLSKTLSPTTQGPFSPGDPVLFRLEITNEGSLIATGIQFVDYIPAGLLLNDSDWQETTPGRASLKTPIASLAAGASASVDILFLIAPGFQGISLTNAAEIASAANGSGQNDEDSTPDSNPNNDAGEDDFDTQSIPVGQSFDLSLNKTLSATTPGPFSPGDPVVFRLEITNQGSLDATNIQISDYIPAGLQLNDPNWQETTPGRATLKTPIASLAAGASTGVDISFVIGQNFQGLNLTNAAEIASAANAHGLNDKDSTPDNNPGNDAGQDDYDTQTIDIGQSFDLSLRKILSNATPGPFAPGDAVVFRLEITNQGSLNATNIQLNDYIPAGLELSDPDWQETTPGLARLKTPLASLAAGASASVDISFVIDQNFQGVGLTNAAEIASAVNAHGMNDKDSTPDNNPDNDAGEDDFATRSINIGQSFDLSLRKILSNTTPGPFSAGDPVLFRLEITNEGSLDATNIQLVDYIPAGLLLNDPDWQETTPGRATLKTPLASLAAGAIASVDILFVVDQNFQGATITNAAEIASASNGLGLNDKDSSPDDNPGNDAGEDDADTETISFCLDLSAGEDGLHEICTGCDTGPVYVDLFAVLNGSPDEGGLWTALSGAGVNLQDPRAVDFAGLTPGVYRFRYAFTSAACGSSSAEARVEVGSYETMACNGRVNVTFDEDECYIQVSPDLLLEGDNGCSAEYEVRLYDERGNFLGDVITGEQAGQIITAEIHNLTCGTYCTGELRVEDATPPRMTCPQTQIDLVCSDADSIFNEPLSLALTGEPAIADNCSGEVDLRFSDAATENGDCGPVSITRRFVATDASGNASSCVQIISVRKPDFDDLVLPAGTVRLSCDGDFPLDANGAPHPSETGFPVVQTAYGAFPLDQTYCTLGASYSDSEPIDECGSAFAVVRTWTLLNWCATAGQSMDFTQVIYIEDTTPPTVLCPSVVNGQPDTLFFSTGPFNCTATFTVPMPQVTDNCSSWTVKVEAVTDVETPVYNQYGELIGYTTETIVLATLPPGSNTTYFSGIPAGCHRFRYTVVDACGNTTVEECPFCVRDNIEPVAVCDNSVTVFIGGAGLGRLYAGNLDEGSWDNCGLAGIGIRRQVIRNENCIATPQTYTEWADYVDLTCCDIGLNLQVELLVIDNSGNQNVCRATLIAREQIRPECIPPSPRSIDCIDLPYGFDPANTASLQSLFGTPTAVDNCGTATWEELTPQVDRDDCGDGTITRSFRARDPQGNVSNSTCRQIVTIKPYNEYEIRFPADVASDCGQETAAGLTMNTIGCDDLGVSVYDVTFTDVPGICSRTMRRYRVINWCTYDTQSEPVIIGRDEDCDGTGGDEAVWVLHRNGTTYLDRDDDEGNGQPAAGARSGCSPANLAGYWRTLSSLGFWQYTQYIDVVNAAEPQLQYVEPAPFCSTSGDCLAGVTLPFAVSADCDLLDMSLYFDENADGLIDRQLNNEEVLEGSFPNFVLSAFFPIGEHAVEARLSDGCGMTTVVRLPFRVLDCLAPAPACVAGLAFDLIPLEEGVDADGDGDFDMGAVEVDVALLLAGAAEDCSGPVRYSIHREGEEPDPERTSVILTCDDADTVRVRIYAWDETDNPFSEQPDGSAGGPNYDYCETYLLVEDDLYIACQIIYPGRISGLIMTEMGDAVENVTVNLSGPQNQDNATGINGAYVFESLEELYDYTVAPNLDLNHRNGVTTFDLTLIEKHILGTSRLDSPFKLIAADVNRSGSITVLDIIKIRRLILAEIDEFEENTSWRFIRENFVFPDPTNPFATWFPEVITLNNLVGVFNKGDFVGVKIGDVNNTAIANSNMGGAPRAATDTIFFSVQDRLLQAGAEYRIPVYLPDIEAVEGYQYTLEFNTGLVRPLAVEPGVAQAVNFGRRYLDEGLLTTSWHRSGGKVQKWAGDNPLPMFTLVLRAEAEAQLSEVLRLTSRVTPAEGYYRDAEAYAGAAVGLKYIPPAVDRGSEPRLDQNFPNPFAGQTLIGYELPAAMRIRFEVFDIRGRLVYEEEGLRAAGRHQMRLDLQQLGQGGIYYYTLSTEDGFRRTRKMAALE